MPAFQREKESTRFPCALFFVLLASLPTLPAICQNSTSPALPIPPQAPARLVLNYRDLNRAFLLSPQEVDAAILKGQSLAKQGKSVQDVLKDNTQQPRGVRGEKGKSHESSVTCGELNGLNFVFDAYQAASRYEPPPHGSPTGYYAEVLTFGVILNSVPKVASRRFESERHADAQDVQVDKFVLTDDKGNVIEPIMSNSVNGVESGTMNFSGIRRIPHTDTAQVDVRSTTTVTDPTGLSTIDGTTTGTVTQQWIEKIPWSENHPFYSAKYAVKFPLFDSDGQPLIKADAKSITLHIITPNGEKAVTYDLKPPKI